MNAALVTYLTSTKKASTRAAKQHSFAVAQTAKEGRELKESALVNAR
jgi:hypothetical protein